jgi:hypothetical protein
VLGAPLHLGTDPLRRELRLQRGHHALDVALAVRAPLVHLAREALVRLRLELAQGEVLQLPLELRDAEPPGQRRVDQQRLARHPRAGLVLEVAQGAHVVEPVGELDQHHPHVAGRGEQQLLEPLHLLALARAGGGRGAVAGHRHHLGDALDQPGDVVPHLRAHARRIHRRVLDHVVQQRGRQGLRVQAEVVEDPRHRQRMGHVGGAGAPPLARVGAAGEVEGPPQQPPVRLPAAVQQARERLLRPRGERRCLDCDGVPCAHRSPAPDRHPVRRQGAPGPLL